MRLDSGLLIAFVALLLVLSAMMVMPYLQFVLAGLVLAFILEPLHQRIAPEIGGKVAAGLLTLGTLVAIVLPFIGVAALVAEDAVAYAQYLQDREFDFSGIEGPIEQYTGRDVDLASLVQSSGQSAADSVVGDGFWIVGTATHLIIGVALLLFLLYYFVKDGDSFVHWLREVSPFPDPVLDDLVSGIDDITRAVIVGHVLIALTQGTLAGIGLAVVGIPNVVFWTFVMILSGLIPLVGTFVVWGAAGVWLLVEGDAVAGVALLVYGTIVVSLSDDFLRPLVVDRYAHVSPPVILIGVVGGIAVWGFMGLFVGPIVVGALREAIEVYAEHYGTNHGPSTG